MPSTRNVLTTLNVDKFEAFISMHGQVDYVLASEYADIGDKIIQLAMTSKTPESFEQGMEQLQETHTRLHWTHTLSENPHSISNMASCILYAQTRRNFDLGQGFARGSNINQYGSPEQSQQTIANLMAYFSKVRPGKECGYDAPSTHTKWRASPPPEGVPNLRLRIDINNDPTTGSIPAPLKGMRTAHFVPGVDKSGVTKLLIKPENWGMRKLLHKICHAFDYLLTRVVSHKVAGLENRPETKLNKENAVVTESAQLKQELKANIDQIRNKPLKKLFNRINKKLGSLQSMKGFETPLQALENVNQMLETWSRKQVTEGLSTAARNTITADDRNAVRGLHLSIKEKIAELKAKQDHKYGSGYQHKSEVRLSYNIAENGTLAVSVDKKPAEFIKKQLREIRDAGAGLISTSSDGKTAESDVGKYDASDNGSGSVTESPSP